MHDPLAQFRRKTFAPAASIVAPEASALPAGSEEYAAFRAKDKVRRMKIRRNKDMLRAPSYDYLVDLCIDEVRGDEIVLQYTYMTVHITGANLQPIFDAIEMGTADLIQEFDSGRWSTPKDKTAPVIKSIKVKVEESGPPASGNDGKNLH